MSNLLVSQDFGKLLTGAGNAFSSSGTIPRCAEEERLQNAGASGSRPERLVETGDLRQLGHPTISYRSRELVAAGAPWWLIAGVET